jgi:hypothetical protein
MAAKDTQRRASMIVTAQRPEGQQVFLAFNRGKQLGVQTLV